jgi:glycosyltransferase involved in cell wall biosynthesis
MEFPKITIITVSYQQGKFIEEAIQSVVDQQYPNLEHLVIDAGSTDQTVAILKKYSHLLWISEPDRGQSDAFNKGIKRATGEVIGFLNSDDKLMPGALATVARELSDHPEKQWLTGSYQVITADGQPRDQMIVWYKSWLRWWMQRLPSWGLSILKINNPIIHPSTFIRRSALQTIGHFDEQLHYCMDYDIWLRLWTKFGSPIFVNQSLSQFRIHNESKGGAQFTKQFAEQWQVAQKYHISAWEKIGHQLITQLTLAVYRLTR